MTEEFAGKKFMRYQRKTSTPQVVTLFFLKTNKKVQIYENYILKIIQIITHACNLLEIIWSSNRSLLLRTFLKLKKNFTYIAKQSINNCVVISL